MQQPGEHRARICKAEDCGAHATGRSAKRAKSALCSNCSLRESVRIRGIDMRFCQTCKNVHPVEQFDGTHRSCRNALAKARERSKRRSRRIGQGDDTENPMNPNHQASPRSAAQAAAAEAQAYTMYEPHDPSMIANPGAIPTSAAAYHTGHPGALHAIEGAPSSGGYINFGSNWSFNVGDGDNAAAGGGGPPFMHHQQLRQQQQYYHQLPPPQARAQAQQQRQQQYQHPQQQQQLGVQFLQLQDQSEAKPEAAQNAGMSWLAPVAMRSAQSVKPEGARQASVREVTSSVSQDGNNVRKATEHEGTITGKRQQAEDPTDEFEGSVPHASFPPPPATAQLQQQQQQQQQLPLPPGVEWIEDQQRWRAEYRRGAASRQFLGWFDMREHAVMAYEQKEREMKHSSWRMLLGGPGKQQDNQPTMEDKMALEAAVLKLNELDEKDAVKEVMKVAKEDYNPEGNKTILQSLTKETFDRIDSQLSLRYPNWRQTLVEAPQPAYGNADDNGAGTAE
jgi:hypothetical protein